jgi:hypothetical protein
MKIRGGAVYTKLNHNQNQTANCSLLWILPHLALFGCCCRIFWHLTCSMQHAPAVLSLPTFLAISLAAFPFFPVLFQLYKYKAKKSRTPRLRFLYDHELLARFIRGVGACNSNSGCSRSETKAALAAAAAAAAARLLGVVAGADCRDRNRRGVFAFAFTLLALRLALALPLPPPIPAPRENFGVEMAMAMAPLEEEVDSDDEDTKEGLRLRRGVSQLPTELATDLTAASFRPPPAPEVPAPVAAEPVPRLLP